MTECEHREREGERRVIRAVWEVLRRNEFSMDVNVALRTQLEAQVDAWRAEDEAANEAELGERVA